MVSLSLPVPPPLPPPAPPPLEATEDNLEEGDGSGFPIWEHVWANSASGLFLASSSMGLTGVEGRGCRYSGCKMCPVRAVNIFSTLIGRRFAWRRGSEGGTA